MTRRSADKPRVTRVITALDCDTIRAHYSQFSSFMKHGLSSHICCGCRRTVGNILLIILSFPSFRNDLFETGNVVIAKTLRVLADSRGNKEGWHADASASVGHDSLTTSTVAINYSRSQGLRNLSHAVSRRKTDSIFYHASCVSHQFYIAQIYSNSIAVLHKVRGSERTLVTIARATGNAMQSNNK